MPNVSVSWSGGIDASVYIDVAGSTLGPYARDGSTSVSISDSDGSYLVRPWCGNSECPHTVVVSGGVASPSSINCSLS